LIKGHFKEGLEAMCKHVLNAQVSIRAPCCKRWFDCPECHRLAAGNDHELLKTFEMVFACKKCKKVFRKDACDFDEADQFCPHCDNLYILPAETGEKESPMIVPREELMRMIERK
jgi:hypothetical protein